MPTFRYTAMTAAGERVSGELAGASQQAALAELEGRRLIPVKIAEAEAGAGGPGRRRVSTRAMATAYAQVSDLLRAGVPLLRALRVLAGQKANPRLAECFEALAEEVAQGTDLAGAMSARPETFPPVHVAMIRAGEKGGFLEQVLSRLGALLAAQTELRGRVIGSLIYPGVLATVGVLILAGVFTFFVPQFEPMFEQLRQKGRLPATTRLVLGMGHVLGNHIWLVGIALLMVGAAGWKVWRDPSLRRRVAEQQTRIPILGPLLRDLAVTRVLRVLGTMLQNSIPMLASLQIARDAAGVPALERAVESAAESVRHGQSLAAPLAESGLIAADIVEMISVGEAANSLDTVLLTIADTLDRRIERQLGTAVKLVEPLILMVLAGFVGLVAVALILPMTQMAQALR